MADQPPGTRPWSQPEQHRGGPVAQVTELKDLVVAYAKQETVDPLKALGGHLGYGIGGALMIGIGIAFGMLALLRGLQELTVFNDPMEPDGGWWSWAPYAIVAAVGMIIAALFLRTLVKFVQQQGSSS